ncbi:tetratricopeptide repeat protein [Spirochaeta thermophila]|uniref:TPR domain protein n=1 Tax=Winmispira thermophila (strain ATCC 49972 / DSM 6192 / RI 19.B1) TaxID=665571 RepID=E0RR43_WINT6|nr:tetratricopeptide repeat protein [Spirochaeta thermophila]ADN01621.1 TPR domain protein [Spirochaeta thermophila DSM 6192]
MSRQDQPQDQPKGDRSRRRLLIAGVVAALLLAGGGVTAYLVVQSGKAEYRNALLLAEEYAAAHEYQRALDILDTLLLRNPGDEEVRALKQRILEEKRAYEEDQRRKELEELARQQEQLSRSLSELSEALEGQSARALEEQARKAEEERRRQEEEAKRQEEERLARLGEEERKKEEQIRALLEAGTKALEKREFMTARDNFNKVLDISLKDATRQRQHHATALAYTAESYYEEGDVREAVSTAQEAIETDPNVWQSYYVLGKIYADNKNYPAAEEQFQKALKLNPRSAETLYELGKVQYMMGLSLASSDRERSRQKFNDARLSFTRCVDLKPTWVNAHYNLALTHERLGRRDDAQKEFLNVIALDPKNTAAYLKLGEYAREKGDYQEAEKHYKKIFEYDGDYRAWRGLGLTYYLAGRLQDAEKAFKEALSTEEGSNDPISAYNLALVLIEEDKAQEALSYAQKAVDLAPRVPEYQYTLGLAAYKLGAYTVAEAAFGKAIELKPDYVKPRVQLGLLHQDKGEDDKALSLLLEAYKLDPTSFEVNNNLGNLYARKKLYSESIKHYRAAIEADPKDTLVRYNLALSYLDAKEYDEAVRVFQELLKIDPSYWDAYYQLGKLLITLEDAEGAKKVLSTLLEKKPDYSRRAEVEKLLSGL